MDFIQEHNEINSTYVNRRLTRDSRDLINKFVEKPHALFYRNERRGLTKTMPVLYNNLTLDITTEPSSTILDWVYDDNLTTTEDMLFGTEMFVTSEFENVTDITLFDKKSTTEKPKLIPKKSTKDLKCDCNILYKTCDINCCCDTDCSDAEKSLFIHNCRNQVCQGPDNKILRSCYSHSECENKITPHFLENLFCISKSNLPDRRLTDIQFDEAAIYRHPRWHIGERQQALYEFKNNVYKYNDPIWLINNKSIYYADIPVPISNHYCSGRKPIKFLVNENINCIVRLNDLHMFQVLKTIEGNVLSPVGTFNTTIKQV
ncbi:unnamed protein product [Leptosia nina]|uniref:Tectonic-1-3 N-terminal domain-containing protein n=1 Tax=Leptosia nina TaxID=320188 RepID=A0AAV1JLW1_9NEOP